MADVTSQALVPPPTALFPQPPQQQPALSGNPAQMLDLLSKIQQNYALGQELKARAAIGQAYQGALQPDGTLDPQKLRGGLANPDASWMLPETMTHVLSQQGAQFDLLAKRDASARALIGTLPTNATDEDLRHYAVTGVRAGIPSDVMAGHVDSLLRLKGKDRARAIAVLQGTALGPGGVSERVAGPPTDAGAPTMRSKGATILEEAAPPAAAAGSGSSRGTAVGLPPGVARRQEGAAETDVQLAGALSHEAEGSQQRRALLGNLIDLSGKFEPGPGASESKYAKAFINRNIPLPEGWKFDTKSIADQEEFAKQAAQFAQKQFDTIGGTGTDAKFNSAFTTSPGETMSRLGIKGVSSLLMGNEDAIQAKNKAWLDASAANPNLSYRRFSQDFQSHYDPRVFQFKYLSGKERQDYFAKMEPQDQARLLHDMTYARKQGWVSYGDAPAKSAPSRPAAPTPAAAPAPAPAPAAAPPAPGSFEDRWAPIPGARPGRHTDGRSGWFIPDPSRPGKFLAVNINA